MTTLVWPFAPQDGMVEAVEWATDVIRTKGGEQRIALRAEPATMLEFRHVMSPSGYTRAQSIIEFVAAGTLLVPDWAQRQRAWDAVESGDTVIAVDVDGYGFAVGGKVLLWDGDTANEVATITAVGSAFSIAVEPVTRTFLAAPLVLPLREGRPQEGITATRMGAALVTARVVFQLLDGDDLGADVGLPEYLGVEVLTDVPKIGGGLETGTAREFDRLDNPFGNDFVVAALNQATRRFSLAWDEFTREEVLRMKQLIYSRRGRQKVFWLPTHERDLIASAGIGAVGVALAVEGNTLPTGEPDDLHIMVMAGGVRYFRQVVEVAPGDDGGQELTLDEPIGVALTAAQMTISLLVHARFDSDRVEFLHRTDGGVAARMPAISTPIAIAEDA
jgi:hypothetical protein